MYHHHINPAPFIAARVDELHDTAVRAAGPTEPDSTRHRRAGSVLCALIDALALAGDSLSGRPTAPEPAAGDHAAADRMRLGRISS